MAFASYDDLLGEIASGKKGYRLWRKVSLATVGVAGTWYTAWPWTGDPAAGGYAGTALNAQQCTDATTGAIPHGGNKTPDTKHLLKLGGVSAAATAVSGRLLLYDRLLYYPGINATINTNQSLVNGVSLPRYTDGVGVQMWLEETVAFGATTGVLTYGDSGYTNSADQSGRQHGITVNTAASTAIARIPHSGQTANNNYNPFLPLQAGDLGVKSVQSIRFTTAHTTTGECALVLGYPLAVLPLPAVNVWTERDFVFQIASLARIYDGACLSFLVYEPGNLVASTPFEGDLEYAWG